MDEFVAIFVWVSTGIGGVRLVVLRWLGIEQKFLLLLNINVWLYYTLIMVLVADWSVFIAFKKLGVAERLLCYHLGSIEDV